MSSVAKFLKSNKKQKENTQYAATKSLTDENDEPLLWTIRPLTTKESNEIRDECTEEIPIKGKKGMYRQKFNANKYLDKTLCASVVEPNLYSEELQNSYGVMSPEELVKEMVDDPGEYTKFTQFIQEFNGFDESFEDKVEKAKNS